jgi:hypothetical protein
VSAPAATGLAPNGQVAPEPVRRLARRAAGPRIAVSATVWIALGLAALALLSRVFTTNSLAGEPTSDEYLYAVHARDIARGWAAGEPISGADLAEEGRSIAVEAAAVSLLPTSLDVLTLGRTIQATLNALCVPMTFLLATAVGLRRPAAVAAALVLLAAPEFQESAWRFWTDSQATLLTLAYLTALVAWCRRPTLASGLAGVLCLGLLVVTKESAAVTLAPFLLLAALVPLGRQAMERSTAAWGARTALAGLLGVALVGLALLVRGVPAELARQPLLQRTFASAPLVSASIRDALPKLPSYPGVLAGQLGPDHLSPAFIWAAALGVGWLALQAIGALLVALRPGERGLAGVGRALGWVVAVLAWAPAAVVLGRDLSALGGRAPWFTLALVLVAVGVRALLRGGARPSGWGLALLGVVTMAFFAERLVISVTPTVANAALTFRSFMPTLPLLAILGGGGLFAAAAGSLARVWPRSVWLPGLVTVVAAVVLVGWWSPLLRQRTVPTPLLGRVADRGADPDTPQGLRVQLLVEAQPWLQANLRPSDITITGIPRHLSWYADLGVDGMDQLLDLGAHPSWSMADRRRYLQARVGPLGAAYVVDFNVDWMDPGSDRARQWQRTYRWLASQPNLEVAYLRRDKFGNPVFYVVRNHGYAASFGNVDHEQMRLEESARRPR